MDIWYFYMTRITTMGIYHSQFSVVVTVIVFHTVSQHKHKAENRYKYRHTHYTVKDVSKGWDIQIGKLFVNREVCLEVHAKIFRDNFKNKEVLFIFIFLKLCIHLYIKRILVSVFLSTSNNSLICKFQL